MHLVRITCDAGASHVTAIGLPNNNLSGAVVLIGGAGSVSPSLPGSSMTIALNRIAETYSWQDEKGVGMQGGAPSATMMYGEFAQNGYTLASGVDGNGIESMQSSTLTVTGNNIHDNNRFGIIGVTDSHLDIEANTITLNRLDGIIFCGPGANVTTTSKTIGNWIAGNGVDVSNGQGYNGLEFYVTCVGTHTVTGNTFLNNSLNGFFAGAGTVTANGNLFENNKNGVTLYVENNSSSNTQATILGNTFTNNLQDGVFVDRASGTTRSLVVTIGGTQPGAANAFSGSGFHGIGCADNTAQVTCPSGGNTFSNNTDDIEAACPSTCVK